MYFVAERHFCCTILLIAFLLSLLTPKLRGQSNVSIAFNNSGLSSLKFQGTDFLAYGDVRLTEVDFVRPDNTTYKGGVISRVAVNPGQQTQMRTYDWGTITFAYSVAGNRMNMTVT